MREILFRGKRLDNGEWVVGCFGWHTNLDAFIIDRPYPTADGDWSALGFYEVARSTVGQYTGLQDKNGKRIFEGDIVHVHDTLIRCDEPHHEFCGVIVHQDGCFAIQNDEATHYRWLDYECEVIGNIHDNPELLEGGRNG